MRDHRAASTSTIRGGLTPASVQHARRHASTPGLTRGPGPRRERCRMPVDGRPVPRWAGRNMRVVVPVRQAGRMVSSLSRQPSGISSALARRTPPATKWVCSWAELPASSGNWRADLTALARNRRAMLKAHPWLGTELAGRPAIGPHALIHYERALAAAAGYTDDAAAASSAVETVLAYVLGAARSRAGRDADPAAFRAHRRAMARLRRPVPATCSEQRQPPTPAANGARGPDLDADERFERGLACVLAGLATCTP